MFNKKMLFLAGLLSFTAGVRSVMVDTLDMSVQEKYRLVSALNEVSDFLSRKLFPAIQAEVEAEAEAERVAAATRIQAVARGWQDRKSVGRMRERLEQANQARLAAERAEQARLAAESAEQPAVSALSVLDMAATDLEEESAIDNRTFAERTAPVLIGGKAAPVKKDFSAIHLLNSLRNQQPAVTAPAVDGEGYADDFDDVEGGSDKGKGVAETAPLYQDEAGPRTSTSEAQMRSDEEMARRVAESEVADLGAVPSSYYRPSEGIYRSGPSSSGARLSGGAQRALDLMTENKREMYFTELKSSGITNPEAKAALAIFKQQSKR